MRTHRGDGQTAQAPSRVAAAAWHMPFTIPPEQETAA